MCRMLAYVAHDPLPAADWLLAAGNGLRQQACGDCRGEQHPDGWGFGWYDARRQPHCQHGVGDARTDPSFVEAAQAVSGRTVLAHVRQASVGGPQLANCHPFQYGPWLFAHNGTITNFDEIGPRLAREISPKILQCRRGTTDSELVFLWIVERLGGDRAACAAVDAEASLAGLQRALGAALRQLWSWSNEFPPHDRTKFNFLLTDGYSLVASRWSHDLHWARLGNATADGSVEPSGVIVASEPIQPATGRRYEWREVPDRSILSIHGFESGPDAAAVQIEAID